MAAQISPKEEDVPARYSLSKLEEMYLSMEGVKTVTFFQGSSSALASHIKERLPLIAKANPWLAGSIKKAVSPGKGHQLVVPTAETAADQIVTRSFTEDRRTDISLSTPYPELFKLFERYKVKSGSAVIANPTEPLVKAVVISIGPEENEQVVPESDRLCALYFDVSHVAADGHSYYQVYNMLGQDAEIKTMQPERKIGYGLNDEACKELLGQPDSGLPLSCSYMSMLLCGFMCGKKRRARCYVIDQEKVQEKKNSVAGSGKVPFVSTNDIATSSIGKATKSNFLEMALNLRGRMKERKFYLLPDTLVSCIY